MEQWAVLVLMNPSHAAFVPTADVCLCCASPMCVWSPNKRIDEAVRYVECLADADAVMHTFHSSLPGRLRDLPAELLLHMTHVATLHVHPCTPLPACPRREPPRS